MKRVLLVSYTFPPVGGAGVQRAAKFTKYLPQFGWQVTVLTAANPSVPLFDDSLSADIPPNTIIERATTWEPSYKLKAKVTSGGGQPSGNGIGHRVKSFVRSSVNVLLQPDPQILWAPNAVRSGRRLLRDSPHDVVLATGPPFSAFLIGAKISRRFGLPLVLDYRDEWDISNAHWENRSAEGFSHRRQQRMQAKVLQQANAVLATTEASAAQIRSVAERAGSRAQVHCIYNGFDPADFLHMGAHTPRERYRITYVGTLWGLTSIAPLVEAVLRLNQIDPTVVGRLEVAVVGRRTSEQDALLQKLEATKCLVTRHEYVAHRDAIRMMFDSDRLCILLTDAPEAGRVVPAKLFEYAATGRPLLTIAPKGEVWNLLERYPDAGLHEPADLEGIVATLRAAVQRPSTDALGHASFDPEPFSRVGQAGQVANILNSLAHKN